MEFSGGEGVGFLEESCVMVGDTAADRVDQYKCLFAGS